MSLDLSFWNLYRGLYDVMYHAFEVCGRRYVPRRGVGAGSWPGVSSAGGITSNFGPILHRFWDTATYYL